MADSYKFRQVGQGLFDQEILDLPPRFQGKIRSLENKLRQHFNSVLEELLSKEKQQENLQRTASFNNFSPQDNYKKYHVEKNLASRDRSFASTSRLNTRTSLDDSFRERHHQSTGNHKDFKDKKYNKTQANRFPPNNYTSSNVSTPIHKHNFSISPPTEQFTIPPPVEQQAPPFPTGACMIPPPICQNTSKCETNSDCISVLNYSAVSQQNSSSCSYLRNEPLITNNEGQKLACEAKTWKNSAIVSKQENYQIEEQKEVAIKISELSYTNNESNCAKKLKNTDHSFVSDSASKKNNQGFDNKSINCNSSSSGILENTDSRWGIEREIKPFLNTCEMSSHNFVDNGNSVCSSNLSKNLTSNDKGINKRLCQSQHTLMQSESILDGNHTNVKSKKFHKQDSKSIVSDCQGIPNFINNITVAHTGVQDITNDNSSSYEAKGKKFAKREYNSISEKRNSNYGNKFQKDPSHYPLYEDNICTPNKVHNRSINNIRGEDRFNKENSKDTRNKFFNRNVNSNVRTISNSTAGYPADHVKLSHTSDSKQTVFMNEDPFFVSNHTPNSRQRLHSNDKKRTDSCEDQLSFSSQKQTTNLCEKGKLDNSNNVRKVTLDGKLISTSNTQENRSMLLKQRECNLISQIASNISVTKKPFNKHDLIQKADRHYESGKCKSSFPNCESTKIIDDFKINCSAVPLDNLERSDSSNSHSIKEKDFCAKKGNTHIFKDSRKSNGSVLNCKSNLLSHENGQKVRSSKHSKNNVMMRENKEMYCENDKSLQTSDFIKTDSSKCYEENFKFSDSYYSPSCSKSFKSRLEPQNNLKCTKTNEKQFIQTNKNGPHSCDNQSFLEGKNKNCENVLNNNSSNHKTISNDRSSVELVDKSILPVMEIIKQKEQENKNMFLKSDSLVRNAPETFSKKQNGNQQQSSQDTFTKENAKVMTFDDITPLRQQKNEVRSLDSENANSTSTAKFSPLKQQKNEVRLLNSENANSVATVEFSPSKQQKKEVRLLNSENANSMGTGEFSLKLDVSGDVENLSYWKKYLKDRLHHEKFQVENPIVFSCTLTAFFHLKEDAVHARISLLKDKVKNKSCEIPHVTKISNVKCAGKKDSDTKQKILDDCLNHIEEESSRCINAHNEKLLEKEKELKLDLKGKLPLLEKLESLREMKCVFQAYVENIKKEITSLSKNGNNEIKEVKHIKTSFHRECNSLTRCLPIYSKKNEILRTVKNNQVSVVIAETGSGKSTQLVEFLLQEGYANNGLIVCTQPRKIAAVSISEYVSGQLGSPVGSVVGYDVGTTKKISETTSIVFTTEFSFLKRCVKKKLNGISCIIVDEAHERTLYTDILLGIIKSFLHKMQEIRIIITSATIDPVVFVDFFKLSHNAVLKVPGRIYPVEIVWLKDDVFVGWDFVEKCVETAIRIHLEEDTGDILIFLTSPSETEEALNLFKKYFDRENSADQPKLYCLHGKLDAHDQMEIFKPSNQFRKIIFATNSAETSITIPGVKYVIDSGMVKEKQYCARRNKSVLAITFISKSSSEQRKGRAGRSQPGVCYRMYSKKNYASMHERALPEILKTNFQLALLKILQCGFQPDNFNFVEKPPENLIQKSLDSLEHLGAIKDRSLTALGEKIVFLPFEPCLSKFIIRGIEEGIGYESAIIAALLSISGKVFFRTETNKTFADEQKIKFCKEEGDVVTFLDVFKQWKVIPEERKSKWCADHCINLKSMKTAFSIVNDIICILNKELNMCIPRRYSDSKFNSKYEIILFECYSENICIFSGHPKSGYVSPYLTESYYIHPSSSLSYIGCEEPRFVLFGTVMETSRNFLLDITPIKEETLVNAYQKGSFNLQVDMLKDLQVIPKIIGPLGESVLIRHILGKQGSKIADLDCKIKKICKTKTFYVEVVVEKGLIIIHIEKRFHKRVEELVHSVIEKSLDEMNNEDHVHRISSCLSCCFSIGSGAIINDIIMPGEFRELIFDNMQKIDVTKFLSSLEKYGKQQTVKEILSDYNKCIRVTFVKVASANAALLDLKENNTKYKVSSYASPFKKIIEASAMYRIKVSWCRIPCQGTGWIEFHNFEDRIAASGSLTTNSIYVDDHYIQFTPASHNETELYMKNVPETADEEVIKSTLQRRLHLNIKSVTLVRKKVIKVSEKDLTSAKLELQKIFHKFTPASKLEINVRCPSSNDIFWNALIYFENLEDGETALSSLKDKAKIGNYILKLEPILKSSIYCKLEVYEILKKDIHGVVLEFKTSKKCTEFDAKQSSSGSRRIKIQFTCTDMSSLSNLRQRLINMLRGYSLSYLQSYDVLTTRRGKKLLKDLEENLKIIITNDSRLKTIRLYGPERVCLNAKGKIYDFATGINTIKSKVFNLKGRNTPSGFLKTLYEEYGFGLDDFVDKYELDFASFNIHQRTFMIRGTQAKIEQAEEYLEDLCAEIFNKQDKRDVKEEEECCEICFDSISSNYRRLENCGHPFCKSCLLLQLESKVIPVTCVKEDCGKPLFIEDIARIISYGSTNQKDAFYSNALQYHVQNNKDSIRYCPSPDCQMVYRINTPVSKITCLGCENEICTFCHVLYHHGITCEVFQKCREDEDYSLKIWLEEDQSNRKKCPFCQTAIEKAGGCNHVECFICKSHLCWLCLRRFPSGEAVYDHLSVAHLDVTEINM